MASERLTRSLQELVLHRVQKGQPTAAEIVGKELEDELTRAKNCKSTDEICELINERLMKLTPCKYTPDSFNKDLQASSKLLKQKSVHMSMLGQHNSGKSTLLNGLLGDMYLPQSSMSATSIKVQIKHNPGVHSGYCPGKGCKYKSGVNVDRTMCPKLVIKSRDDEDTKTGCNEIRTKLQELNEKCREGVEHEYALQVEVVLEVYIPLLTQDVNLPGWSISLMDNPGFGESNVYIQQFADASIMISAAYILVTCTNNMDSRATTSFLKKLSEKDKDAFRDGRVLVGITQFDNNYHIPIGEERITEEGACKKMCKIIEVATGQPIPRLKSVILPISGIWALSSAMLRGIEQHLFPKEFSQRKDEVVRHLNNNPEVMQSLSAGQDENVSLMDMEPSKLAMTLHDASHIEEFTKRLQVIAKQCVHTWRQKVHSNYKSLVGTATNTLVQLHGDQEKQAKRRRKLITEKEERYASIRRELKDIENSTTGRETLDIWKSIDKALNDDIQTQLDELKVCAKDELEKLIAKFEKECEEKVQSSTTKFGPNEFRQDLTEFLKLCESKLEKKLNEMCIFNHVSETMKEQCAIIGERIGALRNDTNRLCNNPTSRATMPGSYASREPSAQKPLRPPSLGDIKSAAGDKMPHLRLTLWDNFVVFISGLLGLTLEKRGTPIEEFRLSDLAKLFNELPEMMWEQCERHFKTLKSTAVKHFYEVDYCPFVKTRVDAFHSDFKDMLEKEADKHRKENDEITQLKDESNILSKNCQHMQQLERFIFDLHSS